MWLKNSLTKTCGYFLFRRYYSYHPRRAVVYIPGSDKRKIQKISSLNADTVILDCEDGVALNKKAEARQNIFDVFQEVPECGRTEVSVRVNSVSSGLCEEDIDVVLSSKVLPETLLLPKVDSKDELTWFGEKLSSLVKDSDKQFRLITFVESARALLDLQAICSHALELSKRGAPFRLEGLVFGSDDFCADIGATRTADARELLYARQYFVTVAKAFQLQAIDMVHINYKDLDGLKAQSLEGAQMGFTGKQVIHPGQIPIVQEAFSPSPEKIQWARDLIREFEQHEASGKGAFNFRGHMIDMPLVLQAKNVLKLADLIPKTSS